MEDRLLKSSSLAYADKEVIERQICSRYKWLCQHIMQATGRRPQSPGGEPEHTTFTRQRSEDADADPYVLRCPSIDVEVITAC